MLEWFPKVLWLRNRPWIGYLLAVFGPGPELWLRLALAKGLVGVTFVTFHPAIYLAAIIGGFGAGLTAVLISAALGVFYILSPAGHGFSLPWPHGWVPVLTFIGTDWVIVALLSLAMEIIIRLWNAGNALRSRTEELEQQFAARSLLLQKTEEQLRQAQKMEAVGQLTGGLAHDFNNILTAIKGSVELLRRRIGQGRFDGLDRYLGAAEEASDRAAAVTNRLLAFSRRQTLDPRPTDINHLIADMQGLISRTVGPAISVKVLKPAEGSVALVDPNQLESALLNLCINAKDALPDGGRITIGTINQWLDDEAAAKLELTPRPYILLSVHDNGCGMSPEVVERAFDPFFTTKPLGQGTGLGLSMTYGFARQSGGNVRIASQPNQGTTVTIYLPRADDQATSEAQKNSGSLLQESASYGDLLFKKKETVLVLDDEPSVRMFVVETLDEMGYHTLEAEDGMEALEILRSDVPVDLLISDVGLPGAMNGRQVADAARAVRPGLRVIFITGYAENVLANKGQLETGMQVLTKPFSMDVLASRVQEVINCP